MFLILYRVGEFNNFINNNNISNNSNNNNNNNNNDNKNETAVLFCNRYYCSVDRSLVSPPSSHLSDRVIITSRVK